MDLARYAELFRTESREHLAEMDAALLELERDGDVQHIAVLFRSTHTIKGMAASMGYRAVEQLSHALETLLDAMRSGSRALNEDAIALLFDGTDALSQAVNDAVEGRGESISQAGAALIDRLASAVDATHQPHASGMSSPIAHTRSDMRASLEHSDAALSHSLLPQDLGNVELHDVIAPPLERPVEKLVEVRLTADAALKGVRALMAMSRAESLGTIRSITPPQHAWNDDSFDGVFTLAISTTRSDADIETTIRLAGDVARVSVRIAAAARADGQALRHVRIDLRRLDTLLDLVGELVITRDRLVRAAELVAEQHGDRALSGVVHDAARLVSALQEEVLRTRMVPVGQVFDRFPRLVRDIARELGRDVTFVTEGREIELDRSLLDSIGDPIVHLLRNALDHGIEPPATRREAGKAPKGRLILRATRDRAAVVVQVEDDGRGINREAVLSRAKADGVVDRDTTALGDDALLRVLAKSGFSTTTTVTSISGRGVGIDVVASRVRALGGTLELESVLGRGSRFTIRLPVTLAIVRALLVRVGDETYALPATHVMEALEFVSSDVITVRGVETVALRDDVFPLMRLRPRFGMAPKCDDGTHLVMVEMGNRQTALQVDSLVGQQDVVVKPYDAVAGAETLFSGATILGDGTPALIVDLGGLT